MNYIIPNWPAPSSIRAYTTLRTGFDERSEKPEIKNKALSGLFSLPSAPIWIKQVHSNTVIEAIPAHLAHIADASFTDTPNRICVILTADCLPIFVCNKQGTQVAAIHAGWRGLAAGIIENTIKQMQQPSDELLIWLGPAIGPSRFEVGLDVYQAFTQHDTHAEQAFTPCAPNKWLANLYQLAALRLKSLGITQIYGGDFCTYSQPEMFFSYRRDKGDTGRMASLIWIA